MKLAFSPLLAAVALAGAAGASTGAPAPASASTAPDWQGIATANDRKRLRQWRTAWTQALSKAVASGHATEIAREGTLLQPDAALDWQQPPPGLYACRTIKIGAKPNGMLDYVAYPAFDCRIRSEDGLLSFAKLTGSQRPIGLLFPYTGERMVFLGTLQLGDETRALQYGDDQERDLAALVEHVGDKRWRLVFPYPHFESIVDVIELTPKVGQ